MQKALSSSSLSKKKLQTLPLLQFSSKTMAGVAFGSFGDSFSLASLRAYLAEFISTLLFVFAGVGSAIAYGS